MCQSFKVKEISSEFRKQDRSKTHLNCVVNRKEIDYCVIKEERFEFSRQLQVLDDKKGEKCFNVQKNQSITFVSPFNPQLGKSAIFYSFYCHFCILHVLYGVVYISNVSCSVDTRHYLSYFSLKHSIRLTKQTFLDIVVVVGRKID